MVEGANNKDLGTVFVGKYSDPNHPGGYREITMLDEWDGELRKGKCVGGKGTKEPEHFELEVKAGKRIDGADFIIIDFSAPPKNGPKDFEGTWDSDGIRFTKDQNKWPVTKAA